MKLGPYLYHGTTLTYQIMRVSMDGRVEGATKKPPENAMKLRESRL